jgi:hypothetical protein
METKTKRSLIIWGIVILAILNVSSLGTIWYHRYQFKTEKLTRVNNERGHQRMQNRADRMHKRPPVLSRGLGLTSAQESKFDSIWKEHAIEKRNIEKQMNSNRNALGKILSAQSLDTMAYMEISQMQTDLMRDLNKSMLGMNKELRKTLNEEQLKLFLEKMEQLNRRMNSRVTDK